MAWRVCAKGSQGEGEVSVGLGYLGEGHGYALDQPSSMKIMS